MFCCVPSGIASPSCLISVLQLSCDIRKRGSILSDAVEGGFLSHNPAWRTYRYAGRKCEKKIADEETAQKIIAALEGESIKYETYFKLIIATGMRRGECCGLKWCDIDWE